MGERIRHSELVERWRRKKPRFFKRLSRTALSIVAVAVTINMTVDGGGGTHADWWIAAYRYILGICAGVYAVCTLTVDGGYKGRDITKEHGRTVLDRDDF